MSGPPRPAFAFFLIPVLGVVLVAYGTHRGAGESRDSLRYLRGAENLARGNGYTDVSSTSEREPITLWPPLYSIAIAAPVVAGVSTRAAVRIVNVICFAATLCLVGVLVRRLAPASRAAPFFAMAFVLAAPAVVRNHLMAWAETLFVPLMLLGLLKLADYAQRDRLSDVAFAGMWLGLAAVTRYVGLAVIAGAALSLWVWDRKRGTRAWKSLATFSVVALAPAAAWFVRNYLTASTAHGRAFAPDALGADRLRTAVDAVSAWLLPVWFDLPVRTLWLALVGSGLVWAWRRASRQAAPGTRAAFVLMALCASVYLGFVLVTIVFFDPVVTFDARLLSPVYVLAVIIVAAALPNVFAIPRPRAAVLLAGALALSFVALASYSVAYAWSTHHEPKQFASARWTNASAWAFVAHYPAATPIYSTQSEVSQYFTQRVVRELSDLTGSTDERVVILHYPLLDDAPDSRGRITQLDAHAVDSSDVVVVYEAGR